MTNDASTGISGGAAGWDGVDRRKSAVPSSPEVPFIPSPADWQSRGLAFLVDLIIYSGMQFGGPALNMGILGTFLSMLYMVFRDGLFGGQSIGKKVMGIRVVHMDGREISYVDSSFRNVIFILSIVYPGCLIAILVEVVATFLHPMRRRLGDRIARTCVVQKASVPVLA